MSIYFIKINGLPACKHPLYPKIGIACETDSKCLETVLSQMAEILPKDYIVVEKGKCPHSFSLEQIIERSSL